jgi:hypothetical protein
MSHPMPHLAQLGGALRQMRMRYTARCKLALLRMAKRLRDEEGISLRKSAERVQVSAAGCEALVVWVGCGSGCEGCVGWLFVLQAPTIPVEL